jgi:hypothetical protein
MLVHYDPMGRSTDGDFASQAAEGFTVSVAMKDVPEKDAIAIMSDLGTNLTSNEAP